MPSLTARDTTWTSAVTQPVPTIEQAQAALDVLRRVFGQPSPDMSHIGLCNDLEMMTDAFVDLYEVRHATTMVLSLFKAYPMIDAITLRARVEMEKGIDGEPHPCSYQEVLDVYLGPGFTAEDAAVIQAETHSLLTEEATNPWLSATVEPLKAHGMDVAKYQHCEPHELACALGAKPKSAKHRTFFARQARLHEKHGDFNATALDLFPETMSKLVERLGIERLNKNQPTSRTAQSQS